MMNNKTSLFCLLILISGCARRDTNPKPIFHEVQEDVVKLTGETVYWDTSLQSSVTSISIEELSTKELTADSAVQIALLNNRNLQAVKEDQVPMSNKAIRFIGYLSLIFSTLTFDISF